MAVPMAGDFPLLALSSTTNFMTTTHPKQEILQSLDNLDVAQSEKVLDFIRGLLKNSHRDLQHQTIKRKALREIGQALRELR
jgi:hypothetical protein